MSKKGFAFVFVDANSGECEVFWGARVLRG